MATVKKLATKIKEKVTTEREYQTRIAKLEQKNSLLEKNNFVKEHKGNNHFPIKEHEVFEHHLTNVNKYAPVINSVYKEHGKHSETKEHHKAHIIKVDKGKLHDVKESINPTTRIHTHEQANEHHRKTHTAHFITDEKSIALKKQKEDIDNNEVEKIERVSPENLR